MVDYLPNLNPEFHFMPPQDRRETSGNEIAIARRPYFPAYCGNNEKETYVVLLVGRELEHSLGHDLNE